MEMDHHGQREGGERVCAYEECGVKLGNEAEDVQQQANVAAPDAKAGLVWQLFQRVSLQLPSTISLLDQVLFFFFFSLLFFPPCPVSSASRGYVPAESDVGQAD